MATGVPTRYSSGAHDCAQSGCIASIRVVPQELALVPYVGIRAFFYTFPGIKIRVFRRIYIFRRTTPLKNVKFVKKALAMVLAAAMSLSLAACGSGAASSASAADSAPAAAVPATEETQASTAGETTANEGTV